MSKQLTRNDVAVKAGVSPSTVSRALQGSPLLPIETIEHIRKIANDLGYHPNRLASQFAKKRSDTLAFVVPEREGGRGPFQVGYYATLLDAVVREAEIKGYTIRILSIPYHKKSIEKVKMLYGSRYFDGMILSGLAMNDHTLSLLQELEIPLVVIGFDEAQTDNPVVNCRSLSALTQMLACLEQKGYEDLIFVSGDKQFFDAHTQESDLLLALQSSSLTLTKTLLGDYSRKSGYQAAQKILQTSFSKKTAVFLGNDLMASGFYRFCMESQIRIPQVVGVIGSDDEIIAKAMFPELSTIRQPRIQMGQESIKQLDQLLKKEKNVAEISLECEFILRESI